MPGPGSCSPYRPTIESADAHRSPLAPHPRGRHAATRPTPSSEQPPDVRPAQRGRAGKSPPHARPARSAPPPRTRASHRHSRRTARAACCRIRFQHRRTRSPAPPSRDTAPTWASARRCRRRAEDPAPRPKHPPPQRFRAAAKPTPHAHPPRATPTPEQPRPHAPPWPHAPCALAIPTTSTPARPPSPDTEPAGTSHNSNTPYAQNPAPNTRCQLAFTPPIRPQKDPLSSAIAKH
ncbi:hypothetical protein DFR75_102672 [Nocardia ignorata]|uniref:Uncharacterized protein n=1 Tax=Nocardia ignorata TaxID=145285 RepID=A0A4R6PSB9_NOCIG|nr:hypothetical protein DFR75_102672 [Nocardia ignorata]